MKAIHVGTTRNSRIYYLLESDDQSTGAVVTANQPVAYVDFFAYVSKKGSIERVMDSEFHKFFWTGHTGSLSERWEQTFIHRVTSPREMALSGVDILTEFKEKKKANRVDRLNERANRAVEYKALIGAGFNDKAFARRGVRRIGRSMGDAASGGVRGFRRGVRFDPEAEDADGDGFVQEGTQHARRAGMRSTTTPSPEIARSAAGVGPTTFLPPKPPPVPGTSTGRVTTSAQQYVDYLNSQWIKDNIVFPWDDPTHPSYNPNGLTLERWNGLGLANQKSAIKLVTGVVKEVVEASKIFIGGNDAKEILDSFEAREAALRALIGGREIRTFKDAKELAYIVHPLFQTGESKYALLRLRDENEPLNEYERTALVTVLTLLKANPLFKTYPIELREVELPSGIGGYEQWRAGTEWKVSTVGETIVEGVKKALAKMGGTWSESGMTPKPFTPEERRALLISPGLIDELELSKDPHPGLTGMEGEDKYQAIRRSVISRLGEMFTLRKSRKGKTRISYSSQAEDSYVTQVEDAIRGHRDMTLPDGRVVQIPYTLNAGDISGSTTRYATADAIFATLVAHADKFPTEEKNRLLRQAAAIAAASVTVHELGGHSTHSVNQMQWALDRIGPDPVGGGDDPRSEHLIISALKHIAEQLKNHPLLDRLVLDSRTVSEYAKEGMLKGLSTILQGKYGIEYDDIILHAPDGLTKKSMLAPGGEDAENFTVKGIHGVLRTGTDIQKQRLKAWLSQPVMDKHGNEYKATAGLSKYFEELKAAALQEWGIDLTVGAGEQLTVAHVLFGTSPHERGVYALEGDDGLGRSTFKSHKKGGFAFLGRAKFRRTTRIEPHPSGGTMEFRARKSRRPGVHETDPKRHVIEHLKVRAGDTGQDANGNDLSKTSAVSVPDLTLLRERGIPAFTTNKVMEDGLITTTAVTPEDTAPLLDALAHVAHIFPRLDDIEFDPTLSVDEVLDQLEDITFDSVPDIEIGLTGKKLDEFLETMSPKQQETFRENFVMNFITDLFLQSLGTQGETGYIAGRITDPRSSLTAELEGIAPDKRSSRINNLVEKLAQTSVWSDDLSDKRVRVLNELADSLGIKDYAAYGGKVTGFDIFDFMLGNTRHEMIAELMTAMILGLDLPIYKGVERQAVSPEQIDALTALFKLWQPDGIPKIRSKGKLVPINE